MAISPNHAAIIIQRSWRASHGYVGHFFEKACKFIDTAGKVESCARAIHGRSQVYLPVEIPQVVLKVIESEFNGPRIDQMESIKKFCATKGYKHLIVPSAKNYRGYIIEDRLPITNDPLVHFGMYCQYPERFSPAVEELTKLFFNVRICDLIVRSTSNTFLDISRNIIRFDNLPLYLDKGIGKIGLIDLQEACPVEGGHAAFAGFKDLALIFPFHLYEICKTVKEQFPELLDNDKMRTLVAANKDGQEFMQKAYLGHSVFLKDNGIGLTNPTKILISEEILSIITEDLKQTFPEICAEFFPSFIEGILHLIQELLNEKANQGKPIKTVGELVSLRSLLIDEDCDCGLGLKTLKATLAKKIDARLPQQNSKKIASLIYKDVINQLTKRGVFYYANPSLFEMVIRL